MSKRDLKAIVLDPTKPEEALEELNQHQLRVRSNLNEPRTYLTRVRKAREPVIGELSFDGVDLFIVINGVYRRILLMSELDSVKYAQENLAGGVIENREGILENKETATRANQNYTDSLLEFEQLVGGLEQTISGIGQSFEEYQQSTNNMFSQADEERSTLGADMSHVSLNVAQTREDLDALKKNLTSRLFTIRYNMRQIQADVAAINHRLGSIPDWVWKSIKTKEDLLDAVGAPRDEWGAYGGP